MQSDVMEDGYTDHELFSLSSIKVHRASICSFIISHSNFRFFFGYLHIYRCVSVILFSPFVLVDIQGKKDLVAVDNTEADNETNDVADSEDDETHYEEGQDNSSSDVDSDEERRRLFISYYLYIISSSGCDHLICLFEN